MTNDIELTNLIIPVNTPLLDSLSLRIPFLQCEILDRRLTSTTCVYYEQLDAIDDEIHPPKPLKITYNGISVRISLCEMPVHNKETGEYDQIKYITLTVSAKLLKERYFDGINKFNIRAVYDEFMSFEIFTCPFEAFINGMVCDIDICFNRYCVSEQIFVDSCQTLFNQTGVKSKWLKPINEPGNKGLQFNKREWATPAVPHVKIYHKELELQSKSADFWNTYLYKTYAKAIKGLTRVEATVKNHKHKLRLEKYGIIDKFRTLGELLELPAKQLYDVIIFCIDSYIVTAPRKKAPELSPTDHIIYELLQNCVLHGYDIKTLLTVADSFKGSTPEATKVARSRQKKKITQLFDLLIHKDIKIKYKANQNAHVLSYLDFVGIKM